MTSKDFNRVRYSLENNVATITLNHPETYNAVSPDMLEGLQEAMAQVEEDAHSGAARCVVITGEGKAFCSGANLAGGSSKDIGKRDAGSALEEWYHPIMRRLRDLPVPTLSAVNGVTAGIGMAFAMMGDMCIAKDSARFILAFRRIGLVPDGGSTWILPRLIGMARAKELALLGEDLSAQDAKEWGLINRVVSDNAFSDEVAALAQKIATGPSVALGLIRKLFWESFNNSYEEQLDMEKRSQQAAGRTKDSREGIRAFQEKRKAEFKGH